MSLAVVFLLISAPGLAFWLAAGPQLRSRLDAAEGLYLVILAGVALLSWPGILLAELGWFSLPALALGSGLITVTLAGCAWWRGSLHTFAPGKRSWPGHLALLPLLALAVGLVREPFPYLVGGRDHGIYVNTGLWIARSGGILIHDPELAAVSPAVRALLTNTEVATGPALVPGPWSEGQRLAGLTIRDGASGVVVPHAFHLYPTWIAIFATAGDPSFGLWATPFLALLGSLGVYFAGARLVGRPAALLALLLVLLNAGQLWFHSYPTAEILVRALFWGGLWAGMVMLLEGSSAAAALAALCLGLLHLTKLDTLFVPLVILPLLLFAALRGRWLRSYTVFLAVYLMLAAHAIFHALGLATIYTLDQLTRVLLPEATASWVVSTVAGARNPATIASRLFGAGWPQLLVVVVASSLMLLLLRRTRSAYQPALARVDRYRGWLLVLPLAPLVLLLAYAGLAYPLRPTPSLATAADTLALTSWYVTPLALLLGMVGLLQFSATDLQARAPSAQPLRGPAWLLLLANSLPLLLLGTGTYPDHFWAARRFVPVLFPALLLGAAGVIRALATSAGKSWIAWLLPAALALALVAGELRSAVPLIHVQDYAGLPGQLDAIAAEFAADDVLLFLPSDASNRIALPLWLLYGQTVFQITPAALSETALSAQIAAWEEAGRSVYLLFDGSDAPLLNGLAADYHYSRQIAVPQMELSAGAIPQRAGYYAAVFSIFRLSPDSGSRQLPLATVLAQPGAGADAGQHGLYPAAVLPGLTPHSWTAGTADLTMPAVPGANTLILQLGNGRPEPVPASVVRVSLNGIPLATTTVSESVALFEWPLPPLTTVASVTVRLATEPWIPAESGHSPDPRPLGVLFYQARLAGGGAD